MPSSMSSITEDLYKHLEKENIDKSWCNAVGEVQRDRMLKLQESCKKLAEVQPLEMIKFEEAFGDLKTMVRDLNTLSQLTGKCAVEPETVVEPPKPPKKEAKPELKPPVKPKKVDLVKKVEEIPISEPKPTTVIPREAKEYLGTLQMKDVKQKTLPKIRQTLFKLGVSKASIPYLQAGKVETFKEYLKAQREFFVPAAKRKELLEISQAEIERWEKAKLLSWASDITGWTKRKFTDAKMSKRALYYFVIFVHDSPDKDLQEAQYKAIEAAKEEKEVKKEAVSDVKFIKLDPSQSQKELLKLKTKSEVRKLAHEKLQALAGGLDIPVTRPRKDSTIVKEIVEKCGKAEVIEEKFTPQKLRMLAEQFKLELTKDEKKVPAVVALKVAKACRDKKLVAKQPAWVRKDITEIMNIPLSEPITKSDLVKALQRIYGKLKEKQKEKPKPKVPKAKAKPKPKPKKKPTPEVKRTIEGRETKEAKRVRLLEKASKLPSKKISSIIAGNTTLTSIKENFGEQDAIGGMIAMILREDLPESILA